MSLFKKRKASRRYTVNFSNGRKAIVVCADDIEFQNCAGAGYALFIVRRGFFSDAVANVYAAADITTITSEETQ